MKPTEEKIQGNASDLPVYLFKMCIRDSFNLADILVFLDLAGVLCLFGDLNGIAQGLADAVSYTHLDVYKRQV